MSFFCFKRLNMFCGFSENLLRGINDLIALVKKLQQDIANQHGDIKRLQSLIENCAGCQEPQNLQRLDTCLYANPCFPGKFKSLNVNHFVCPKWLAIICI